MNREQRRAMIRDQHQHVRALPARLTPVPHEEFPTLPHPGAKAPLRIWRSSKYLVQQFDAANPVFPMLIRLSINRTRMGANGHWEDGLTWDELQAIKTEIGYGDWYGLEVYPPDSQVVNVANIRHLWLMPTSLPIGWVKP